MKSSVIRVAYGVALVTAVIYAFVTMRGPHGITAWMDQRQEIRRLEDENATLARENQLKRQYLDRLARSREEQELVVRRKLKLLKPNEKVFMKRTEDQPPAPE